MDPTLATLNTLVKALEAGNYNAVPSTLVNGSSLQVEDLSPVMQNVTFEDKHIKLTKDLSIDSTKSQLAQFNRQLSYGSFGGSAQLEGHVGQEETDEYVRIVVPMAYYSHVRKVTIVANMVQTVDGKKAEDRQAESATKKLAADVEFDMFRGKDDFSNAGLFDGNPGLIPNLPSILGLGAQIRMSDSEHNAQDQMFGEFGSDDTVVIAGGSTLTQDNVEDGAVRSAMNFGNADRLIVDPRVLSNYNKITQAKERIVLAGSPQDATGSDLKRQWVSGGTVQIEASRFLSGKTRPQFANRINLPQAPASNTSAQVGGTTPFVLNQAFVYYTTAGSEVGEGPACAPITVTIAASGNQVNLTINHPAGGTFRYFNVYRSASGGTAAQAKFIGRVIATAGASSTAFADLGNKQPGFVTGYLIEKDTMAIKELSPYSRVKLAVTQLEQPEAHFRFLTLAVMQPRKNVLIDNLR